MKNAIFLGGTCGNNNWRDGFMARMSARGLPIEAMFNPIVKVWDAAAKERENRIKRTARYILIYLGDPKEPNNNRSFFSLLEGIFGLFDAPDRMIVVFDYEGVRPEARDSMRESFNEARGRFPHLPIFSTLAEAEEYLADKRDLKTTA